MFCHREDCALCREGECLIGDKLCSPDRCVGSRAAQERYETLKAMNLLAKEVNDEGFYYDHWIYIVPDEADDDELREIAYDAAVMQFGASSIISVNTQRKAASILEERAIPTNKEDYYENQAM